MKISNFRHCYDEGDHVSIICWNCGLNKVEKKYQGRITAELLYNSNWLVVVEPFDNKSSLSNAKIYNSDGTMKLRINCPWNKKGIVTNFRGTYIRDGIIKLRMVGYQESTRISFESEFDLDLIELKLVNEHECR